MSSQSLRGVLVCSLLAVFFSLGGAASGEAAALFEVPDVPSLLSCAWQWLTAPIAPTEGAPAAATAAAADESDRTDAGWILDPNG